MRIIGQYDLEGFQAVTKVLGDKGAIKNLYYSDKFPGKDAVATFDVRTDLNERVLKKLLLGVPSVTEVVIDESSRNAHRAEQVHDSCTT